MAELTRAIALYIDGDRSGGLNAQLDGTTSSPPNTPQSIMAGDKCALSLYFRRRASDNGASTVLDLPAGSTIVVAGKIATPAGSLLFVTTGFTAGTNCYSATIDLNTDAIATAMSTVANGAWLDVYIDIEIRDASDSERLTFRVTARLFKQVYEGGVSPSLVVLPAAILQAPGGSRWQLTVDDNGVISATRIL